MGLGSMAGNEPNANEAPVPRGKGWRNFSVVPQRPAAEAPARQEPNAKAPSRGGLRSLMFAVVGFLAGVAFWHTVGFWTFVTDVVLNGPDGEARVAGSSPVIRKAPPRGEVLGASAGAVRPSQITTGSVKTAQ